MNTANPLHGYEQHVPTFIRSFKKIICIGDSLTEGSCNYDGGGTIAFLNYSYPAILEKMTGVKVINYGISGDCASTNPRIVETMHCWFQRAEKRGFFLDYHADLFLIALGTNDISKEGYFTGSVETDIDMENYRNNKDTSVGGYGKIIGHIKEHNPKAYIMCITIPNTRNEGKEKERADANEKIRAIAKKLGCYVIDLEKYAEQPGEEAAFFQKYYKNKTHNNALGYNVRARQYCTYVDYIMEHNLEDFRNMQFVNTDYTFTD